MTTTIALVCRNPRHDHDARMVSRFTDAGDGQWKPAKGHNLPIGEECALIWEPTGEVHVRYKFPCGAERTQTLLHATLDEARTKGKTSITLN